jgi:hypothetical protein
VKALTLVRPMTAEDREPDKILRRSAAGLEEVVDDRDWFELDPDVVYPAALDHAEQLATGELTPPVYLIQHAERAKQVAKNGWALAREYEGDPDELGRAQRQAREAALEVARLVFTAYLRVQNGGPIGVHILDRPRWKL